MLLCGFDPASSLPINVELRRMQLHAFLSLLLYLNSSLLLAGFVLVFRLRTTELFLQGELSSAPKLALVARRQKDAQLEAKPRSYCLVGAFTT